MSRKWLGKMPLALSQIHTAITTGRHTDVTTVNMVPSHPIDAQIYYLYSKSLEDASLPLVGKKL